MVELEADMDFFQFYSTGIITDVYGECGSFPSHLMLIVGYNIQSRYWILKNSWGADWGELGYVRVAFSHDPTGTCGMYKRPMYFTDEIFQ